jgi:hypothetical protein
VRLVSHLRVYVCEQVSGGLCGVGMGLDSVQLNNGGVSISSQHFLLLIPFLRPFPPPPVPHVASYRLCLWSLSAILAMGLGPGGQRAAVEQRRNGGDERDEFPAAET